MVKKNLTHPHRSFQEANLLESLSPEMILAQLERIVSSAFFVKKRQLCRFLTYIVEETLTGKSERLKGYTIAVDVFGRNPDFNPQLNPVVRVRANQLRKALQRYYLTEGSNDQIRIDVPKGGYVPSFQNNDRPLAVADTIAEEASPDCRSLVIFNPDTPTIAVLSLENLSADPEHAYFATGLTQEFVTTLMRFTNLVVIGPLLREKMKADGLNIHDVYREYGARFLLDGSVHWHNGSLRVRAKLIDTSKVVNLWGETYHYNLDTDDWFEIEDDVAGQVVATIADNFGVIPQALSKESLHQRIESCSTYAAMLRYYHAMFFPTPETTSQALQSLKQVPKDVPNYATILAMLADLSGQLFFLGMRDESVLDQAEILARQAISLEPNHQHAHWVTGWFYFLRFQAESCIKELEIALSLNPNHANLLGATAYLLAMVGQWDQAIPLAQKAMRLNPHHPGWYHFVFYLNYFRHGEYEAALNEALRINSPQFYIDPLSRSAVLGRLGRITQANAALQELESLMPDFIKIGRKQLRIVVFSEENVEILWDGLIKGGLRIES